MMTRISAQERLGAVNDRAVAFGSLESDAAGSHMELLQQNAGLDRAPAAPGAKADPGVLASMGIGVVMAPPEAAEEALSDG